MYYIYIQLVISSSMTGYIGEGHFGKVHKGHWMVPGGKIQVAIKTLNPESSSDDEVMLLKEAATMGQFIHPNVVKLLGVVTVGEPVSQSSMHHWV